MSQGTNSAPARTQSKNPIIVITEGIAFFLSGGFLINAGITVNTEDIVVHRLSYVPLYSGYLLLILGILYCLQSVPKLNSIGDRLDSWSKYIYPIVFGVTSIQILEIALDSSQNLVVRGLAGVFVITIVVLVIRLPARPSIDKASLMATLILTYIGMAAIFIGLRAETFQDLTKPEVLEPLVFLIAAFVSGLFLHKYLPKRKN